MTSLAPGQNEGGRPRSHSLLSHESKRSRRSSNSNPKMDMIELSKDKKKLNTKADPNLSINEAQPSAVALEESNLDDLRIGSHNDFQGNLITDPDRSNPTRPRLERPLDTIRSFQMAAEATYSNRRSTYSGSRPASQNDFSTSSPQNRRSSYYGASNNGSPYRPRPGARGSYYQGRGFDNFAEEHQSPVQPHPNRTTMRYGSSPTSRGPNGEYMPSLHSHQISYDTTTSSSDQNPNSTNPSSQNSSVDQFHQQKKLEAYSNENQYLPNRGYSPGSQTYSQDELHFLPTLNGNGGLDRSHPPNGQHFGGNQNGNQYGPPALPAKEAPRVPIRLDSGSPTTEVSAAMLKKAGSQRRQSWFKRKFNNKE